MLDNKTFAYNKFLFIQTFLLIRLDYCIIGALLNLPQCPINRAIVSKKQNDNDNNLTEISLKDRA